MRKKIKISSKIAVVFCVGVLITGLLNGCWLFNSSTPEDYIVPAGYYQLQADFSNGVASGLSADDNPDPVRVESKNVPIKSEFYDAESKSKVFTEKAQTAAIMEIADYLTEWTGLDFTLNGVSFVEHGVVVDWSKNSTLLAGLDDREQKDDFRFFDAVGLNWFMMDSLKGTIKNNMQSSFVYYCSDGEPLKFSNQEDMESQGLTPLSADEQYYGSHYYVSQNAKNQNDTEPADWWGIYKNADETKTLSISNFNTNPEGIYYFNFVITTTDGITFDGTATVDGYSGQYMDMTFAMGIGENDVTIWIDEPQTDSADREIFVDTYFRTTDEAVG